MTPQTHANRGNIMTINIDDYKSEILDLLTTLIENKVINDYHSAKLKKAISETTHPGKILELLAGDDPLINHQDLIAITKNHLKACQEYYTSYTNQESYKAVTEACKNFLVMIKKLQEATNELPIEFNAPIQSF